MSLHKRANSPYWHTEFVVKGRRISRSTGTTSRREAEQFEKRLREQIAREVKDQPIREALSLDQACARYWIEHGKRLRWAGDVERYLRYIVLHLDRDMPLRDLSARHITQLVAARRAQGAGDAACNRTVQVLQCVHNRAAKQWDETVKVIDWRLHKSKEKARVRWITPDEASLLLEALPAHIQMLVQFLLLTGLRKREAMELSWDRVSFERGTITVIAKGGLRKEFPISPEVIALLHEVPRTGASVFNTTNWRKHFDAAETAAGLTDLRWHDLRHIFATWLRQGGAPLEVVCQALGHSSIAVTQKYAHVSGAELRSALQKLPALSPSSAKVVALRIK